MLWLKPVSKTRNPHSRRFITCHNGGRCRCCSYRRQWRHCIKVSQQAATVWRESGHNTSTLIVFTHCLFFFYYIHLCFLPHVSASTTACRLLTLNNESANNVRHADIQRGNMCVAPALKFRLVPRRRNFNMFVHLKGKKKQKRKSDFIICNAKLDSFICIKGTFSCKISLGTSWWRRFSDAWLSISDRIFYFLL